MICANCLTWPVIREGELCAKCEREERERAEAWDEFPPGGVHASPDFRAAMDLGSAPSVTVRALCEIRAGQLVVLDRDVSDRHFPDIDQMLEDTAHA